jgi:hypothetical protein
MLNEHYSLETLVRERTIPTEQQPFVDEVSANFSRIEGCQHGGSPMAVIFIFKTGAATFISSSFPVVLTGLSGPSSRPTTSRKI